MRLKAVVLPEPLGPISAVTVPSLDREAAAVDGSDAAEALRQPLDCEQRRHGAAVRRAAPRRVAPARAAARVRRAGPASEGRTPRGSSSMTARKTAA